MTERISTNWLDRIPYTPLLHLVALLTTVAVVIADFVITLRNMQVNQANWDKFHDFLPFLYLWAAGQFVGKRFTAWKPDASTTAVDEPPVIIAPPAGATGAAPPLVTTTRSEAGKPAEAGQPAAPVVIEGRDEPPRAAPMARPSHAG